MTAVTSFPGIIYACLLARSTAPAAIAFEGGEPGDADASLVEAGPKTAMPAAASLGAGLGAAGGLLGAGASGVVGAAALAIPVGLGSLASAVGPGVAAVAVVASFVVLPAVGAGVGCYLALLAYADSTSARWPSGATALATATAALIGGAAGGAVGGAIAYERTAYGIESLALVALGALADVGVGSVAGAAAAGAGGALLVGDQE